MAIWMGHAHQCNDFQDQSKEKSWLRKKTNKTKPVPAGVGTDEGLWRALLAADEAHAERQVAARRRTGRGRRAALEPVQHVGQGWARVTRCHD